jgi:acyl dehydratase
MTESLFSREFTIRRTDLAAYAAASGDSNPIHLDDAAAQAAGLPGVIAHGMYTMGLAARAVTEYAGDPARLVEFTARFAKPVPVPAGDAGTTVSVTASVRKTHDDGRIELNLAVHCGQDKVLAPARATLLPSAGSAS